MSDENVQVAEEQLNQAAEAAVTEPAAVVEAAPADEAAVDSQASEEAAAAAETQDLVTITRRIHEIDPEVSDAVVLEFTTATLDNIGTWTPELLLAILKGQIRFPESDLKHVIIVHRQRVELPAAWSDKQVVEFVRSGQEPKKTTTDVWVTDVTRAGRVPADWATAELEAWALNEIQAGGKSHDNGLAIELKARLKLSCEDKPKAVRIAYKQLKSAQVSVSTVGAPEATVIQPLLDGEAGSEQLQHALAATAQIEKVEGLTSMNVAFIDDGLNKYVEATQPNKPISEAAALQAQNALDTLFQYAVRLEPQAMVAALERIKVTFKREMERGGVFDANNVYRFTHMMRSDNKRQQRHIGLLELFRIFFSEAKGARKQVDVRILLQFQEPEKIDQLVEYFTRVA